MRLRTVLLVLAAVAVAVFALLNWEEFTRPSTLNLGWQTVTAPLGTLLLVLLALVTLVFIATSVATHTRHMMETRQHQRTLQAQRELAERAEASRFTDLRTQLDNHLRESRQREMNAATEMEQTVARIQRELRNQLEQLHRALGMRIGEMEARLESRIERAPYSGPGATAEPAERPRIARNPEYLRSPTPAEPSMRSPNPSDRTVPGGSARAQRLGDTHAEARRDGSIEQHDGAGVEPPPADPVR